MLAVVQDYNNGGISSFQQKSGIWDAKAEHISHHIFGDLQSRDNQGVFM
jgi:hypothetical protein